MEHTARDEFLRRYATSPIHVPRLERLLAVYGAGGEEEGFCRRFIGWDRACADAEAARIVTEILSEGDGSGRITGHSDEAVRGAIRWMSDLTPVAVADRAHALRARLAAPGAAADGFAAFLAGALDLTDEQFRAAATAWLGQKPAASGRSS
jgi:hypothetical protein